MHLSRIINILFFEILDTDFYITLSKDVGSFLNGHSGSDNQATSDQEMKRTHSNDSLSEHSRYVQC